jgi:arabinogalactan endo-1,4-beta-galactosidase
VGYPARDLGKWIENPQAMRWPQSPEGQAAFLDDINRFVQSHPRCVGWYWWYPEAVPVEGVHLYEGGASALFDEEGRPRPAMTRFRP